MATLPKHFIVRHGANLKLFTNCLYKPTNALINVIWPIDNVEPRGLIMRMRPEKEFVSYIRKWNSKEPEECIWSFEGASMEVLIFNKSANLTVPVISINDIDVLPYNCEIFRPSSERFIESIDSSNYGQPTLFHTDPANPENQSPIPGRVTVIRVQSTPVPPVPAVPSVPAVSKPEGLPSHITKIVLANAISKNEVCPITSESITMENGYVTSCGHVFSKDAIQRWFSLKNECPVCKQKCL